MEGSGQLAICVLKDGAKSLSDPSQQCLHQWSAVAEGLGAQISQLHHSNGQDRQQAPKVSLTLTLQLVQCCCHNAHDLFILLQEQNVARCEGADFDSGHHSQNTLPEMNQHFQFLILRRFYSVKLKHFCQQFSCIGLLITEKNKNLTL